MKKHISLVFITLFLIFDSRLCLAGPELKFCLRKDCKPAEHINIDDNTWSKVRALYQAPFQTDKDEQDNIVSSIALINQSAYQALARQSASQQSAEELFDNNSSNNKLKNTKFILAVLMDEHLVTRHFLRRSIKTRSWIGFQNNALLLQSLTNGKLYLLEVNYADLQQSTPISPYKDH